MSTVGDTSDRTVLREAAGQASNGRRKRTRRPVKGGVVATASQSVGTVHRTGSVTRQRSRNRGSLVWASVVAAVVVVALALTATVVLGRTGTSSIPTVSDIKAGVSGTSVTFRWADPGTETGDTYVIASNGGASQQSGTTFVVTGSRGDEECVTVTVNRDGKNGDPSAQKCVTIGDD